jgi:hypothetical protein
MKQLNGYVYGHYDSRGGSSFVTATSREEADKRYAYHFWTEEFIEQELAKEDWWEGISEYVKDDFMCEAVLHVPDDFDPAKWDTKDLENAELLSDDPIDWEKFRNTPGPGMVLAPGEFTKLEYADEDPPDFLNTDVQGPVDLEFVPTGSQPQVLTKFCHPRWDDDAYNFIFLK